MLTLDKTYSTCTRSHHKPNTRMCMSCGVQRCVNHNHLSNMCIFCVFSKKQWTTAQTCTNDISEIGRLFFLRLRSRRELFLSWKDVVWHQHVELSAFACCGTASPGKHVNIICISCMYPQQWVGVGILWRTWVGKQLVIVTCGITAALQRVENISAFPAYLCRHPPCIGWEWKNWVGWGIKTWHVGKWVTNPMFFPLVNPAWLVCWYWSIHTKENCHSYSSPTPKTLHNCTWDNRATSRITDPNNGQRTMTINDS